MKNITEILGGIGILIAIYLLLSHGNNTTSFIDTVLNGATNMIKVLQGR